MTPKNKIHKTGEYLKLIENVTNEVKWDWDIINNTLWWSDNYYNYFGYKKSKNILSSESWKEGLHPEDRNRVLAEIDNFIKAKKSFWSTEYRFLKANFSILNIYNKGNIFYDKKGVAVRIIGSMTDISDQKKAEQDLIKQNSKLQNLSAFVQQQREKEKLALAYEVHEQLGQDLIGVQINLSFVIEQINALDKSLASQLTFINKKLTSSIEKVRKFSSELYPGILQDIGLPEALEWYSEKFSNETGMQVLFSCEEEKITVSAEAGIVLYRIYQQALLNSVHHEANEVICTLRIENNAMILSICDNGENFMKAEEFKSSVEFHAIEENLATVRGNVEMEIDWSEGTAMITKLPINNT